MKWELLEIEEYMDGRVWARWETVADDGHRLVEGAFITPQTDDPESEVEAWLRERQTIRERINANPKKKAAAPRIRRTTARMTPEQRQALADRVRREDNGTRDPSA